LFQSTPPALGGDLDHQLDLVGQAVSIHAPRREGDFMLLREH
jgi:hypothetical protein